MNSKNTRYIQDQGYNIHPNPESGAKLDDVLLNIIQVNSPQTEVLSAFLARSMCYRICKKATGRVDYKEYVLRLQLDNFPAEFKKAELGNRIAILLPLAIVLIITGAFFCVIDNGLLVHGLILFALSSLCIWRIILYVKKIRNTISEGTKYC